MPLFLIIIGIVLILLNIRAVTKEKKSFQNTLNKEEIDITEVEILVGELRREFSETIIELQQDILELKESKYAIKEDVHSIKEVSSSKLETMDLLEAKSNNDMDEKEEIIGNSEDKVKNVSQLLSQGLSIEEICEKLGIGKGEVLLIKELYKK
ncbi:DUF6115 domain-containing protein [Desnuesiella massiliensis]|uniref:DUF6115 domain-containing protein n=1 Tax=Desnuesiella massiliensis TaxID=1650662 RepID=UPI0006E176BD|nr:hypothetical protein [Desnuesiella massiliensis]